METGLTDRGGRQRVHPFCFAFGLPLPRNLRGPARGVGSSLAGDVDHLSAQCDPLEVSVVPDLQLEGVEQLPLHLVGQVEHVQINVR